MTVETTSATPSTPAVPKDGIHNVIVCGSGPSGYTAALYLARANLSPVILAGSQVGGQLTTTTEVENFPGFPDGVDGNELMTRMEEQAKKYGAVMHYELANSLTQEGAHWVIESGMGTLRAHTVVIATGASPRLLGMEGEQTYWNYGVHTCAVCDGGFYRGKEVIVVGGGDSAMEEATYLAKLCSKVTIIHRRDELRASKVMADRALATKNIEFAWNSVVDEVLGETDGKRKKVTAVRLRSTVDNSTREIPASAMFVAIGHTPNTAWMGDKVTKDENGYIIVDSHQRTNLEGVFAAGDCHDHHYRQAITAAGYGCMAALEVERHLTRIGVAN
jgi:thioredoxin reductase (NADPH)